MRAQILVAVFLLSGFAASAQDNPTPQPGQLKDPRAILAAAAPFYDFSDPTLKPFHLKATYQLYDDKGNPSEQGTFEYWWASPKVHRATWTRPGATRTDWHTADGKEAYVEIGERVGYFEDRLWSNLFSPLRLTVEINQSKTRPILNKFKARGSQFLCVSDSPLKGDQPSDFRMLPTQCFDPTLPALRIEFESQGMVATNFDNLAKFQGKYLARTIQILGGNQKLFTAAVDTANTIDPSDSALVASKDAIFKPDAPHSAGDVEPGSPVKKQPPVYPRMAKVQGLQGNVLLDVLIGVDGKVMDPRVLLSPSPLLSAASIDCVSQWEYKPTLLNGVPTQVHSLIVMEFVLHQ